MSEYPDADAFYLQTFSAPFAVPKTKCPRCRETMTPARMVTYLPPEYPGGSPADANLAVLWHLSCAQQTRRDAVQCTECGERHTMDGACLL